MDGLGEKLFPGPGFAGDEDVDAASGGLGQELQAGRHFRRISDDAASFQGDRRLSRYALRPVFQGPDNRELEGFERSRLLQVIPGPILDGELGLIGIAPARDHDNFRRSEAGFDLGHALQAVSVGHPDVQEHDVERLRLDFPKPVPKGVRTDGVVS